LSFERVAGEPLPDDDRKLNPALRKNKKAAESTGRPKHDRMREDRACAL